MGQAAPTTLLDAALEFHTAGCSVVPVRADGTKTPAGAWKAYQATPADRAQITSWFANGHPGLGVVCGAVSGNLEMLELEGRAVTGNTLTELSEIALASGLADLWRRVTLGYCERTPSGGVHFLYRVDGSVPGNTKLARRPASSEELAAKPDDKIKVLVETRGEGGFVVVAPSYGPVHPTGQPWVRVTGSPATIPTISAADHEALHLLTRMADRLPPPEPAVATAVDPLDAISRPTSGARGVSPGDDYNDRGDWTQLLTAHGWQVVWRRGPQIGWRRPGKTDPGISATTGYGDRGDWLYVFTTSTEFDAETTYTKFAAYTVLEHAGDFRAAASALRAAGYGTPPPLQATPAGSSGSATERAPSPAAGATATVTTDAGLTDVGNSDLLVHRHAHEIRYVPERGAWLTWGGSHWRWDDAGHVQELAKDTIRAIPTTESGLAKHRHRSLSRRAVEATVALARTNPAVVAPAALLDCDPYVLCTPSGVVDLHTGRVTAADPADLHTRATAVTYDPDAPAPRWQQFLDDTFQGHPDVAVYIQRLAGYSATGVVTHHVLPFLFGAGSNGKTVFLEVIAKVLGDYATTAPNAFLMDGQRQHETEIARLAGQRFVVCSEVNQDARFDEAKVKLLTGGDTLTARFMHQNHFTFAPSHHLWLMGNYQPRVSSGGGTSFWRRLRLIPFLNQVPEARRIDGLDQQLVDAEGPGILAWIVAGARQILADGLAEPSEVMAATETYAAEEDALARFVSDRCHLGGGPLVRLDTADMRKAYVEWCRDEGEKPVSPQVLGRELRSRYSIDQVRSNGRRFYTAVTLLSDETEPEPEPHWSDR